MSDKHMDIVARRESSSAMTTFAVKAGAVAVVGVVGVLALGFFLHIFLHWLVTIVLMTGAYGVGRVQAWSKKHS